MCSPVDNATKVLQPCSDMFVNTALFVKSFVGTSIVKFNMLMLVYHYNLIVHYPKSIIILNLTSLVVASHLQTCNYRLVKSL